MRSTPRRIELLKTHGVAPPEKLETSAACSDGATLILELRPKVHAAAVISSYAKPLLEGCGTINKGDLRVVGETTPVPFVAAFATSSLSAVQQAQLRNALTQISAEPLLRIALETKNGFVPAEAEVAQSRKKKVTSTSSLDRLAGSCPRWPRRLAAGAAER